MGEKFDEIKDPELKAALRWRAKNIYIEALILLEQGPEEKKRWYIEHEVELTDNSCEGLAATGDHARILENYRIRDTPEGREAVRAKEERLKQIGESRQHPEYYKIPGKKGDGSDIFDNYSKYESSKGFDPDRTSQLPEALDNGVRKPGHGLPSKPGNGRTR